MLCVTITSTASASDKIYWANYDGGSISVTNLDGSGNASDLYTNAAPRGASVGQPSGLTLDPGSNRIYWANWDPGAISRGSLDGCAAATTCASNIYPLSSGGPPVENPSGLAIDTAHNAIYWAGTVGGGEAIQRANLDGTGNGTTVNIAGATSFFGYPSGGLVIDSSSNRIYWTNFMWGVISSASLADSGGSNVNLGLANNDGPWGLAIDKSTNKVYWATQNGLGGAGSISWAKLDGSASGDLYTASSNGCSSLESPNGIAIDPGSNKVYWGNYGNSTVMKANLDGSGGCTTLNTAGATNNGPDAVALLKAPSAAGIPVLSGGGSGATLTCSQGQWDENIAEANLFRAPSEFTYQWTRNGVVVSGATGASYVPSTSGSYACVVTATNAAGSTSQTSSPASISVADSGSQSGTTASPVATTSLTAPVIKVKRPGVADCVRVSSRKATFSVPYTLTEQATVKGTLLFKSRSAATVGSCKPSRRTPGKVRFRAVRNVSANGVPGKNKLKIKLTSGGKTLRPGRYRVRLQATNSQGVTSSVSGVNFLLVVGRRQEDLSK